MNKLTKLPASPPIAEVAEALSLSPSSVSRIVERGENILDKNKDVAVKIEDMEI